MNTSLSDYCNRQFMTICKRFICFAIILTWLVSACGCKFFFDNYRSDSSALETSESTSHSEGDSSTSSESATSPSVTSVETSISDSSETTALESTAATTQPNPLPANPSNMYSSYAFMKAFDPATGMASFDYFDILKGQDAIDFLVSNKGYTPEAAAEEVNNYADSEYVLKNLNPQLRYADMTVVPISMMYDAAGVSSTDANTIPLSYADFLSLYQSHPGDVVDGHFFYFVTVTDGQITAVDQVYWP